MTHTDPLAPALVGDPPLASSSMGPPWRAAGQHRHPRNVLASLWLFAILNYLYCDVLSLFNSEHLEELLTGTVGGIQLTQGFLLGAALLMTVPMGAVLVTRIASQPVARWASVAGGAFMTVVQAGSLTVGSAPTLHYVYFSAIEISTTAFIAWYALTRWRSDV